MATKPKNNQLLGQQKGVKQHTQQEAQIQQVDNRLINNGKRLCYQMTVNTLRAWKRLLTLKQQQIQKHIAQLEAYNMKELPIQTKKMLEIHIKMMKKHSQRNKRKSRTSSAHSSKTSSRSGWFSSFFGKSSEELESTLQDKPRYPLSSKGKTRLSGLFGFFTSTIKKQEECLNIPEEENEKLFKKQ